MRFIEPATAPSRRGPSHELRSWRQAKRMRGMSATVTVRDWRRELGPYAEPDARRSLLDVATSVGPYVALMVAMYYLTPVSPWLVALVTLPAAGCLLRTYIVFHDCAHGSFLPSKRANLWLGTVLSL